MPQDLLKFGLIPEFVGRLPIVTTLEELDKEALINILTKPKNALVKQYKKLLAMDGVDLEFKPEAVEAIVEKAIERKTGARGLRSIIEEIMRDIMFDIPSNPKIEKCIVTKETVDEKTKPEIIINESKADLKNDGVKVIKETDELIIRAITLYCKAEFGFNNNAEQFRKSYDALKMRLALSVEYNTAPEVSETDTSGAESEV